MKKIIFAFYILGFCNMSIAEDMWSVGKAEVQGKPVVYKFLSQAPKKEVIVEFPWLSVVSWKYDGNTNNGMPIPSMNKSMIMLEDALERIEGEGKLYQFVYSATGNGLKEFVFYITDRDKFMEKFNKALSSEPVYPLEINFYEDKGWSDFKKLLEDFAKKK